MAGITKFEPYPFQQSAIDQNITFLTSSDSQFRLVASPTGTGKSIIGLHTLQIATKRLKLDCWFVTPSLEIIADMLRKLGKTFTTQSEMLAIAHVCRLTTPLRLRNAMLKGEIDEPDVLIIDEGHHAEADTYVGLYALCKPTTKYIALTATPYRGTPKGTADLYKRWGSPEWAISYPNAMKHGYLSMPRCQTWGLVDDDLIEMTAQGEFEIAAITSATNKQLDDAIQRTQDDGAIWGSDGKPLRPTIIGVPTSQVMPALQDVCGYAGLKVKCVTQATSYKDRQKLFEGVVNCNWALVHINVISEGVDLPIRCYLDFASTMSPVRFVQRFGRATRPIKGNELAPRYICINRNLERHGYLLEGCLPPVTIAEAQAAFEYPSERNKVRAFGLESLGRLKPTTIRTKEGLQCSVYAISHMGENIATKYLCILHPAYAKPLWLTVENQRDGESYTYGKWSICSKPPEDIKGFRSSPPAPLTTKQKAWWDKAAAKHGLDASQQLDAKKFQVLPALADIRGKL